ncbi:ATP-binding protein [Rhodonellum sp.]|uniref:ATP-binding protein n=1 Tax=Rhodonellum sp. TaxID=2231180 RepID=UPI002715DDEF|nr:ATP-binding protein [Rhodonellum sp.]MDO9553409.1 ATP-binding protein [Rhodonellum sp.]
MAKDPSDPFESHMKGGEMGKLIRNFDWGKTLLGNPENWPVSLQNTLNIVLTNRFPMALWWGKELIQFYNDAYIDILGIKHPKALGQSARECWKEVWEVVKNHVETPLNGGPSTWIEDMMLEINRNNFMEETHFAVSYSPIPDLTAPNGVGGVIGTVHEIGLQVISERRMMLLRDVAANANKARLAEEACVIAAANIVNFPKDIPFALIYLLKAGKSEARLVATAGIGMGEEISPFLIEIGSASDCEKWNLAIVLQAKKQYLKEDLQDCFEDIPQGPWTDAPKSAAIIPLRSNKPNELTGFIVLGISSRLRFDGNYKSFFDLLCSQISSSVATASIIEDERKRAATLAEIDIAKTAFFNNISHEFRTPLTLILGPLETIINSSKNQLSPEHLESLKTTHRNALRLLKLVNNLLDFSLIQSGRQKANFEQVDIGLFTKNLASTFRSVIENEGLQFIVNLDPITDPVFLDKEMWEKIVFNLLSNALKNTLTGTIQVDAYVESRQIKIKVSDSGIGIPKHELENIFDRFFRVQNSLGRSHEGSGLGLAMIKELVHIHGGTIQVESILHKGSTFTISIPTGKEHLPEDQIYRAHTINLEKPSLGFFEESRILLEEKMVKNTSAVYPAGIFEEDSLESVLIVDDNADMLSYLEKILESEFRVHTAENGKVALEKIAQSHPDIILSDIMMPIKEGIQLLKEIKENPKTAHIPVILLSARAGEDSKIQGIDIGANDFITKPFSAKELIVRMKAQLKIKRTLQLADQHLKNLFQQAPVAICIFRGIDYVIEFANEAMIKFLGKKVEQVLNKPVFESMPVFKDQGFEERLKNVLETGKPFIASELPITHMRGGKIENIYIKLIYEAMRDGEGKITGVMALVDDITDQVLMRKKVEESENRYRELIHSSPFMIASFKGEEMIIEIANNAILEQWGQDRSVIGKSLFSVLPDLAKQGFDEILANVYRTGEVFTAYEMPVTLVRNGIPELFYFNFIYYAQRDLEGNIIGIIDIANEVTPKAELNKSIRASEEKFRKIINLMPEKVSNANQNGEVIYYNQSWADYTGTSIEELVTNGWEQWIHPEDLPLTIENWNVAVTTGKPFEVEARMLDKNGHYKWHMSRARPIKDENGAISMWIGVNSEIQLQKDQNRLLEKTVKIRTKKLKRTNKELKSKNQELIIAKEKLMSEYSRSLIEASLDPLITISPDGKITDVNEAMAKITGKTRLQLINSDFAHYFTEPQKAKEIYLEVFNKGFVKNYPLILIDGELIDVLFNGSTYNDQSGSVVGAVVIARVITEQKRIQRELIKAKDSAESARTIAETAQAKAEVAVIAKQQFLSNMSHEIRTPMNAIIGFTNLVMKTDLSGEQKEYMDAIQTSGETLLQLINDILDLAKVNSGQMTFVNEAFNLRDSLTSMLKLFEPKAAEKGLVLKKILDKNIPKILLGDPLRLHQILLNLLSNAIKFTSKGEISLGVRLLDENEQDATLEFDVHDTGIGIPENKLKSVFGNFQQASDDTSKLYGGTGLGLAIAKQLVESQGGSIQVRSHIGQGSSFSFILKLMKTKDEIIVNEEIKMTVDVTKNIKVLVAEDVALNQLLIKTILHGFGFEFDVVDNGEIALQKLQTKSYDIILMDLQMPVMNGFEATKHIREILKSNIPIIALTADVTTMDKGKCLEYGMTDYLAKPIHEKILYNKIVELVVAHFQPNTDPIQTDIQNGAQDKTTKKLINLEYLKSITSSDKVLIKEIISVYLTQTPQYLEGIKLSLKNEDWKGIYQFAHKMIPSFFIIGLDKKFSDIATDIQDYSADVSNRNKIQERVDSLQAIMEQVYIELEAIMSLNNNSQDGVWKNN